MGAASPSTRRDRVGDGVTDDRSRDQDTDEREDDAPEDLRDDSAGDGLQACPRCGMRVRRSEMSIHLAHAHNVGPQGDRKRKGGGRGRR